MSKGYGNMLYERGKDSKVDYAVDYTVDFFQGKFGDGGIKSDLIDVGGGILGNLANSINESYKEKMAKEAAQISIMNDFNVYISGPLAVKKEDSKKADQTDLLKHYSTRQKMPHNNGITIENNKDYLGAINLLNEAIDMYRQNPDRDYYLYQAYTLRGNCKMEIGNYKAAVVDFYFAYEILENILNGKLPNRSFELVYPKGYLVLKTKKLC